jgi:hypothetical protein
MNNNVLTKPSMYGDIEEYSKKYSGLRDFTKYVITSDTDSIFVVLQDLIEKSDDNKKNIDNVLSICKKVENFLNNDIVPKVVEKHQVDLTYNKLKLKNELVCKRGLFLVKKRYALHIILNEGKEVNETFIRGIETRRSDYPALTKKYLKTLLDMLLVPEEISFVDILDFVGEKRKEITNRIIEGDKDIARPSSFGRELSKYTRVPPNVISMLNWNCLMYEHFYPGTRGYLFKLLGFDEYKAPKEVKERYYEHFQSKGKKLEIISVPRDEHRLPPWFIPDVRAMIKFSWDDRVNPLVMPLGLNKKSKILTWED